MLGKLPSLLVPLVIAATPTALLAQAKTPPETRLEAAIKTLANACQADATKYCSAVSPGEGRLFFCLLAYKDKVSYPCDHALYSTVKDVAWVLEKIEEVADACGDDIAKICPSAEPGSGEIAACLKKNVQSATEACRVVINKLPAP